MPVAISNPEKILRLLDSKLTKPMELTIYGRAALALGFAHPKADFLSTKDVDAVIPICTLDGKALLQQLGREAAPPRR